MGWSTRSGPGAQMSLSWDQCTGSCTTCVPVGRPACSNTHHTCADICLAPVEQVQNDPIMVRERERER